MWRCRTGEMCFGSLWELDRNQNEQEQKEPPNFKMPRAQNGLKCPKNFLKTYPNFRLFRFV
jgi:hypothetical protein